MMRCLVGMNHVHIIGAFTEITRFRHLMNHSDLFYLIMFFIAVMNTWPDWFTRYLIWDSLLRLCIDLLTQAKHIQLNKEGGLYIRSIIPRNWHGHPSEENSFGPMLIRCRLASYRHETRAVFFIWVSWNGKERAFSIHSHEHFCWPEAVWYVLMKKCYGVPSEIATNPWFSRM